MSGHMQTVNSTVEHAPPVSSARLQKNKEQSARERERVVEEERLRADQLEEQKSFVELQNELLTEMVAAEQVRWR